MFPNKQSLDLEDSGNLWVGISPGVAVSDGPSSVADVRVCGPWDVPHAGRCAGAGVGAAAVLQESATGPHFSRV